MSDKLFLIIVLSILIGSLCAYKAFNDPRMSNDIPKAWLTPAQ